MFKRRGRLLCDWKAGPGPSVHRLVLIDADQLGIRRLVSCIPGGMAFVPGRLGPYPELVEQWSGLPAELIVSDAFGDEVDPGCVDERDEGGAIRQLVIDRCPQLGHLDREVHADQPALEPLSGAGWWPRKVNALW
jgi:hypothetical protein